MKLDEDVALQILSTSERYISETAGNMADNLMSLEEKPSHSNELEQIKSSQSKVGKLPR